MIETEGVRIDYNEGRESKKHFITSGVDWKKKTFP